MGLNFYSVMKDTPLSDLTRQASIKTYNPLMPFSDSSWKDCRDNFKSIGAYIILYQGGPIYHGTHVTGPVSKSIVES